MSRIDNIAKSFSDVADLCFDNILDDIAIIQVLYIRDKKDRADNPDGKMSLDFMMTGTNLFDIATAREYIRHKFNNLEMSGQN